MNHEKTSYFELLDLFDKHKNAKGTSEGNRIFIDVRKELIKRYSKHSEAYKYWIGRVYKERKQILERSLLLFFDKARRGWNTKKLNKDKVDEYFVSCVHKGVYEIYSTHVSQQKAAPLDTRQFITHLSQTDTGCPNIYIFPQQRVSTRLDRRKTPLSAYLSRFSRYKDALADNFAYHVHPKKTVIRARRSDNSRITLRLVPEKAVEVFRKVAIELVGSDDKMWKVYIPSSKIMGPTKLPKSSDSMIIYVGSRDRGIIREIVEYLTTNFPAQTYFRPGGPMGMFELSRGITYADSSDPKKGKSFGGSRGTSIHESLASLFLESLDDPKKNVFEFVDSMKEYKLHTGSYQRLDKSKLDYTMPAFRRPFSNIAVDVFGHHVRPNI